MKNITALVVGAILVGAGVASCAPDEPESAPRCYEDEACWDWKVDGNRTAGGTVTMFDGETFDVLVTVNEDGSYFITEKE